jgi:tetratricopeptide (TPR) repeat protein
VLYELLTGETPFDRERLRSAAFDEMLRIIREEEPSKPSTKVSSSQSLPSIAANRRIEPGKLGNMIRGELDWIVLKAMEKDRGRRYETASKFAEDVEHYLNDEPVVACPPSRAYKFRKFARRNKAALGTVVVVAASLIVGIMSTSWQAYRATKAEALAEQQVQQEQRTRERAEKAERAAKQQTEKAESEAAAARAMFGFLAIDLLGLADSNSQAKRGLAPDPDLKVRTLLDRAAQRMEGRFTDQPRAEIALRNAIGSAYLGVDATEEAEKHVMRALEISRKHGWHATPVLKTLAEVYRHQLRFDKAAELAREIYEIQTEALGEDHPETLDAMSKLANALAGQQKFSEAESLDSRRLEILLRERDRNDLHVMQTEHNLAVTYELQGKLNEASELLSGLLERRLQVLPPEHPDIFRNRLALGSVLQKQGHYDKAERLFRELANTSEHARGGDHYFTLLTKLGLAETLAKQERFEEVLQLAKPLLDTCTQKYGRDNPRTVEIRQSLANTFSGYAQHQALNPQQGKRSQDELIEFAKQGVLLNPEGAQHRAILGLVHARFEQWEAAATVFEQLAGNRPERLGPYGFQATVAYWQSGRRKQAREQYGVSLRALEEGSLTRDETVLRWKREAEEAISQNGADAVGGKDTTGEAVDESHNN